MQRFGGIAVGTVTQQVEHQVDLIFTCGRVGPIQNKVFMKTVIAAIQQHARYAFAFFFEPHNGKRVARF